MNINNGLFVVFEGGDSSGKTTQARLLAEWLESEKIPFLKTFEPGDSWLGAKIRELVMHSSSGDISPRAETLLYAADKAQHLCEVVLPALQEGKVVVCDRYVDSLLAYQGAGRKLELTKLSEIVRWATNNLRPDLTVLLDVDPSKVISDFAEKDRLESAGLEFHKRVREYFLQLASQTPQDYLVLPGRTSLEGNAEKIRHRVLAMLNNHKLAKTQMN